MASKEYTAGSPRILLRVQEAADLLGLSRATMYGLLAANEQIPVVRIGRSVRIPLAALQTWVDQQTGDWQPASNSQSHRR
jgi:excisionase family DNA binding protein